jgi:putative transposase
MTKAKQSGAFKGHRFPPEIISYAVWAYFRFPMSFRDVEDLLYKRGVIGRCCIDPTWFDSEAFRSQ